MISGWMVGGLAAWYLALAAVWWATVGGRPPRVALDRRTPPGTTPEGPLAGPSQRLSHSLEASLNRSGRAVRIAIALDAAGRRVRPADFLLLVASATLSAGAVGLLLSGPLFALVLAASVPVVTRTALRMMAARRKAAFADQLDDSLQMMAGSLRAGHSLLRSVDAVSQEADEPTSTEFRRIVNETRVGRDLRESLDSTAARMGSADFSWVAQAIAVHREVGGDLAEVLDTVSHTLRERNQIRRQVKALSAEGRLSATVLILLPIAVSGFLMITNPGYLAKLTSGLLGWSLLGAGGILLTVGSLWLRKVVSFKF